MSEKPVNTRAVPGFGFWVPVLGSRFWVPALRWLTGLQIVNHYTLSDFRVSHGEALQNLFCEISSATGSGLEALKYAIAERVLSPEASPTA